jgi:hypothetical protein
MAGNRNAIRTAMMAITTSNSTSVMPRRWKQFERLPNEGMRRVPSEKTTAGKTWSRNSFIRHQDVVVTF